MVCRELAAEPSRLFVRKRTLSPSGRFDLIAWAAKLTSISLSICCFEDAAGGSRLLELGLLEMSRGPATIFRAEVKASNPASARVFSKHAFEEVVAHRDSGVRVFELKSSARRKEA